jgi:hypothetical protein
MRHPRLTDQLRIEQEPRSLFGRHLLRLEEDLAARQVSVLLRPLTDLWQIHERSPQSWNGMPPMLDTRIAAIADHDAICMVFHDRHGEIVAANASKFIDLGDKTLTEACEDLTFFFGSNAAAERARHRCIMSAPSARDVRGRVAYPGGMWIKPDLRRSGLLDIVLDLCRLYGPSRWSCDFEFGLGAGRVFARPEIRDRYHFAVYEPSLSFYRDGQPMLVDGTVCISPIAYFHAQLERRLADPSTDRRGDQQRVASA